MVGYYQGEAACAEVIRDINDAENEVYRIFTEAFQQGVKSAFVDCLELIKSDVLSSDDFVLLSEEIWKTTQAQFNTTLSSAFQKLVHNETFGVGHFVNFDRDIIWSTLIKSSFSRKHRAKVNEFLLGRIEPSHGLNKKLKYQAAYSMRYGYRLMKKIMKRSS